MNKSKKKTRFLNRRRNSTVERVPQVLIVTEGTKTELDYFKLLRAEYGLPRENIQIFASKRSDATHVVNEAKRIALNSDKKFQLIFCVFDRDNENQFNKALEQIERLNRKKLSGNGTFIDVTSVPCFEYWFLLHMTLSQSPYGTNNSACEKVIIELKCFDRFKNYNKANCEAFFNFLTERRSVAVERAKEIIKRYENEGISKFRQDPSTRVFKIVELFENIDRF